MDIDLTPLLQALIGLAAAVISGLAIWVGASLKAWLDKKVDLSTTQIDEQLLAQYNAAVLRGIAYAETALNKKASTVKVDIDNDFILTARDYVMKGWPDLIERWGLDPGRVAETVISRLPSETTKRADSLAEATAGSIAVKTAPAKT